MAWSIRDGDGFHICRALCAFGGENMTREEVETALNKIRPALQADGGNVELVALEGNVVKVKLTGACGGCPMSQMTLKMGIEKILKQEIPSVEAVESV